MNKPVYVVSGFLDSGKTRLIKETLYNPNFNEGEKTVILAFEQGDEEFDSRFLKYTNSEVIYFSSIKELTKEKMKEIEDNYEFDRVFIELNGLENDQDLYSQGFIPEWELAQTLATIDGTTFSIFANNMKQFLFNHILNTEVCIINRSDGADKKFMRNNLKAINRYLEIIFEDKDGKVSKGIDEILFDTSKNVNLSDEDYGIWYMDALDNALKYEGCSIEMNLLYVEKIEEYENAVIMGRKAMVCCANDIQNISLTVVVPDESKMKLNDYYHVSGEIHCMNDEQGNITCVVYAKTVEKTDKPKEELVYFN